MRQATVEDVRNALATITSGLAPSSARQVVLRVKSLLSYGHRLGYLPFNAGAVIRVHAEARAVATRHTDMRIVQRYTRAAEQWRRSAHKLPGVGV
jgi:integrase/recombinase XerD